MSYQPLKMKDGSRIEDWMMLGVVSASVLNASMSEFRTVTMIVMAAIFVMLAAAIITVVFIIYRQHVHEKEVQLKSRDSLFDMLTANTRDIYILFSPYDFTAEYISSNMNGLLGLDPDDIKKDIRNLLSISTDEPGRFDTEGLLKLPVGQTWESDLQLINLNTEETLWYKLMLYRSVFNGEDRFVMMLSDRTKEISMAKSLEQACELAEAANKAKSNFLSNMSHDIRTLMNAIIGFATLISKDVYNPEKVLDHVKKITASSQHLLGLINDILDMSKIESGKTSLNMQEFSLSELLEEVYLMMRPQAKAKMQSFEIHTKGTLPDTLLGDKLRLNQIIINLLSNAIKYTPDGGDISFSVELMEQTVHNHAHLMFTVKDNGIGMSEEYVKTVFDPFSREENTYTKKIQGTGLEWLSPRILLI